MRLSTTTFLLLLSSSSFAGGGFNWLNPLVYSTKMSVHFFTLSLIALLIIVAGFLYKRSVATTSSILIPDSKISIRSLLEGFGEFIYGISTAILGTHRGEKYFDFVACTFLFIFLSNAVGLIPGFLPPTEDINTTFALGVYSFLYYNYRGIKDLGAVAHFKHFLGPFLPIFFLMLPIEIISHCVRPFSLALRLRGNMYGDHQVLSFISNLFPYVAPIPFYILGLFVCFMQAFVFTLLSTVYIEMATHHDHGDEH